MPPALHQHMQSWMNELGTLEKELGQPSEGQDARLLEDLRESKEALLSGLQTGATVSDDWERSSPSSGLHAPIDSTVADAYCLTSASGIVVDSNDALADILNFPHTMMSNQPLLVFISKEQRRGFLRELLLLKQEQLTRGEWLITLQPVNAPPLAVFLKPFPKFDATGRVRYIRWSMRRSPKPDSRTD